MPRKEPMDKEALLELGEFLGRFITITQGPRIGMILPQTFESEGCDHTFARTTEWLERGGRDVDSAIKWLKRRGAACDCRIITDIILRLDEEF